MIKEELIKLIVKMGINNIGMRITYAGNSIQAPKTGLVIEWFGYCDKVWCVDLLETVPYYDEDLYNTYMDIIDYIRWIRYGENYIFKDIVIRKVRKDGILIGRGL